MCDVTAPEEGSALSSRILAKAFPSTWGQQILAQNSTLTEATLLSEPLAFQHKPSEDRFPND